MGGVTRQCLTDPLASFLESVRVRIAREGYCALADSHRRGEGTSGWWVGQPPLPGEGHSVSGTVCPSSDTSSTSPSRLTAKFQVWSSMQPAMQSPQPT